MGRIDPEFVLCVPYDKLGDTDWWHSPRMANSATSRAEWLHPAMRHIVPNSEHSNLHAMLEAVRVHQPLPDTHGDTSGDPSEAEREREVYVAPLREMVWSLEDAAQCAT